MNESGAPFLTAEWRNLLMINYAVEPAVLASRVPRGVELDAWQGQTLVSIVAFQFLNTRLLGLPVPGHRDFAEVNLRFYVRRRVGDEVRRGVVFVKELVPRPAISLVARLAYNENYATVPMRHHLAKIGPERTRLTYQWRAGGWWNQAAAQITGRPYLATDDDEETFISEHYWGYARQRDGSTVEYRVEHPRWPVWSAEEVLFHADVSGLYGPAFEPFLSRAPTSAFVAEGSPVTVRRGQALSDVSPV
jgi:uncharacterized protein YqjF (DUF2071 family)